jgi:acid stress-induced BolA-like protein IbaG/YrbA
MVEEPAVLAAKRRIERILSGFVGDRTEAKASVFGDEFGHLHAVVVTDGFMGVSPRARQDRVRDYLQENASPKDLAHLFRLYLLTASEFDESYSGGMFLGKATEMPRVPSADYRGGED